MRTETLLTLWQQLCRDTFILGAFHRVLGSNWAVDWWFQEFSLHPCEHFRKKFVSCYIIALLEKKEIEVTDE